MCSWLYVPLFTQGALAELTPMVYKSFKLSWVHSEYYPSLQHFKHWFIILSDMQLLKWRHWTSIPHLLRTRLIQTSKQHYASWHVVLHVDVSSFLIMKRAAYKGIMGQKGIDVFGSLLQVVTPLLRDPLCLGFGIISRLLRNILSYRSPHYSASTGKALP